MTEVSPKSNQPTSTDTSDATSLPVSPDGNNHSNSPSGETDLFGQEVRPANHSPSQENKPDSPTSVTYTQSGLDSLMPADLRLSLENKLQAMTRNSGSILWRQTWRRKVTPSGIPFLEHTASAHRIDASASTLQPSIEGADIWATPVSAPRGGTLKRFLERQQERRDRGEEGFRLELRHQVQFCPWPTPIQHDSKGRSNPRIKRGKPTKEKQPFSIGLAESVQLVPHQTPTASMARGSQSQKVKRRLDDLERLWQPPGETSSGSSASMEKQGVLNPAFILWLMGFPAEWACYAPSETPSRVKRARSLSALSKKG